MAQAVGLNGRGETGSSSSRRAGARETNNRLFHDSVGQVHDARGVDHPDEVELDAARVETIQKADPVA
jgi:hypothetical protein